MTFKMYKNKSERDVINKDLTHVADLTGYFKDDTELINPVLVLSPSFSISNENYFIINGYNYFVNGVTHSQQRQYVQLEIDDLETFKTDILKQYAIIGRSSNHYNCYQVDPDMPQINSAEIITKVFPNSFTGESLLLTVAGGHPSTP